MQSSWSSAARNARGLLRNGAQTIAGGFAGAARGAKSVVNRMGRGIAGVGKAGVDSVARQVCELCGVFGVIVGCKFYCMSLLFDCFRSNTQSSQ